MSEYKIDKKQIEKAVIDIINAIGEDIERDGLKDTPQRIADMYEEIFSGIKGDPKKELKTYVAKNEDEMIIIKDIPFYSVCEHHLLPFFGKAHIVYIPKNNRITGFSSMVRVIDVMAKRPIVQERLTHEIADFFMLHLKPMGVLVIIEAEHLCMSMRGVKKPGSITTTSAVRGVFQKNAKTRAEAIQRFKQWKADWQEREPKAVACLEADLDDLLTCLDMPQAHRPTVRTTNPIERAFREVRKRTRPMSCFNNPASIERIIFAVLSHLNANWSKRPIRHFTQKS